jgi:XTP/dITP diphosphohydrolase
VSATAARIVLASGNAGKVRELQALLRSLVVEIVPQTAFGIEAAGETGLTFVENAILKARHATRASGLPAIAEDSGIEVEALGGAPGIHSARYAGAGASDPGNVDKLLAAAAELPDAARGARFVCVMVYLRHALDPTPLIAQGTWAGRLLRAPRGANGFGYDPIFEVPGHGCSSAQLAPEVKNALSHRGQAARTLLQQLAEELCRHHRTP